VSEHRIRFAEKRIRVSVAVWCFGQLLVLMPHLAVDDLSIASSVLLMAVAIGTTICLAAALVATFAAWQVRALKKGALFRCAALWFASGSCAIAWLATWFVR
jgi:hypothetical protein